MALYFLMWVLMINSQSKFENSMQWWLLYIINGTGDCFRGRHSAAVKKIVLYVHEYWHRIIDTELQRWLKVKVQGGKREMYIITSGFSIPLLWAK